MLERLRRSIEMTVFQEFHLTLYNDLSDVNFYVRDVNAIRIRKKLTTKRHEIVAIHTVRARNLETTDILSIML